jgi:hypothetical protein
MRPRAASPPRSTRAAATGRTLRSSALGNALTESTSTNNVDRRSRCSGMLFSTLAVDRMLRPEIRAAATCIQRTHIVRARVGSEPTTGVSSMRQFEERHRSTVPSEPPKQCHLPFPKCRGLDVRALEYFGPDRV